MERYGFDNGNGTSMIKGLRFLEYPVIKRGQEIIEDITMPGRKGTLTIHTGTYEDTVITNVLHLRCPHGSRREKFLDIRAWLLGSQHLIYSDNPSVFYRVKKITVGEPEWLYREFGRFDVIVTCAPGDYLISGKDFYKIEDVLYNPYSVCEPIYHIKGEGACTLAVNGNTMKANVGQGIAIDTEKKIAYRGNGTLENTAIAGDYENLYLKSGENDISVSAGFDLKIIPNWRYL